MPITPEFLEQVKLFKEEMYQHHQQVSEEKTPQVDGSGKQIIKHRPDGRDYIEDSWMTDRLNKHFPGWSWERAGGLQFLGSEWVVADGMLCIIDESLLAFGINPPIRRYWAGDSVRIQFKKDMPHTMENIIDIGDNVQSAITGAKKRAINRLCGIGDDVYGKRIESEGAGDLEAVLITNPDQVKFFQWTQSHRLLASDVCKILNIKSIEEITNYKQSITDIKKYKGWI